MGLFVDGYFEKNIETEESGFFSLDSLPPLSVDRVTEHQKGKLQNISIYSYLTFSSMINFRHALVIDEKSKWYLLGSSFIPS